jgi:tetratricopeptide (TPR) repeat protein
MSDQLKDIKRKIDISKDVHEKIDLQNQLAWELRLTDLRQSLTTAEQVCQAALEINYEKGIAESLRTQTNAHQLLSNFDLSFEKGIGALAHYRNLNDKEGEAYIITLLARNSYILGDYENSLKYNLLSMQIREAMNDIPGVISTLTNIGNIYGVKRDYDNALKHFLKGLELGVNHEGKTRPNST